MGNRESYAKFQKKIFRSNGIISNFCPPLFRKQPIPKRTSNTSFMSTPFTTCKRCAHEGGITGRNLVRNQDTNF